MRRVLSVLMLATFVFFYPLSVMAYIESGQVETLRCGTHLARLGEMKPQVATQCGVPAASSSGPQYGHGGNYPGVVDQWIYNMGPADYVYTLVFMENQLIQIRRGDRGY